MKARDRFLLFVILLALLTLLAIVLKYALHSRPHATLSTQTDNALRQPDITLGLDKLYWGMSQEDVLRAYPRLEHGSLFKENYKNGTTPHSLRMHNYEFQGCQFDVELNFIDLLSDDLSSIGTLGYVGFFDYHSTAACSSRIKSILLTRAGPAEQEQHKPTYELIWTHRPTAISFTDWKHGNDTVVIVTLLDPPHLIHALELQKKNKR